MSSGELCNAEMTLGGKVYHCSNWAFHTGHHTDIAVSIVDEHGNELGCEIKWPNLKSKTL